MCRIVCPSFDCVSMKAEYLFVIADDDPLMMTREWIVDDDPSMDFDRSKGCTFLNLTISLRDRSCGLMVTSRWIVIGHDA